MGRYEQERNYPFAAYITNLGKYNEGELVGEWVKFPTTAEVITDVFKRIGIGAERDDGGVYEEWFISDYDYYVDGLYDRLGAYANLDELNYLANKIQELPDFEFERFQMALCMDTYANTLQDMINLTDNLDRFIVYPEVDTYEDLGEYYIREFYADKIPERLKEFINYKAYGRSIAEGEDGHFTHYGYCVDPDTDITEYYDGDTRTIPEEYEVTRQVETMLQEKKMIVLMVEPMKEPYVKEISPGLKSLQNEVGGFIEAIYPFDDPVALVCNEEGKLLGLELNRGLFDDNGRLYDIMAGLFMVVGLGDEDFASLSPDLIDKYEKLFEHPELFLQVGREIVVLPVAVEKRPSMQELLNDAKQQSREHKPPERTPKPMERDDL